MRDTLQVPVSNAGCPIHAVPSHEWEMQDSNPPASFALTL
jgi:hypothetical protein